MSNFVSSNGAARPTFDPKALLAPRSAKRDPARDSKDTANSYQAMLAGNSTPQEHGANGTHASKVTGAASLIETMHNIEKREERPYKRQKKDSDDELEQDQTRKKDTFTGGGKGGVIAQHIKDQRKEGASEATTIDLTNDGMFSSSFGALTVPTDMNAVGVESDELQIISQTIAPDDANKEVCLGRIENARVNAHRVPTPKIGGVQSMGKFWPPMRVALHRRPGSNTQIIGVTDPMGKDFGTIDVRVAMALVPLMDSNAKWKPRFTARLDQRPKLGKDYPGSQCSEHFAITILVYAPKRMVKAIGALFSQKQIWLREPLGVEGGVEVMNPHDKKEVAPSKKGLAVAPAAKYAATSYFARTNEEVRQDVFRIFDNLKPSDDLPEMDQPRDITTSMLAHQKQALWFMTEREKDARQLEESMRRRESATLADVDATAAQELVPSVQDSLWQERVSAKGKTTWYNVITGHETEVHPDPTLGGILADVMGLGKTLNVLSLIMNTMNEAAIWGRKRANGEKSEDGQELTTYSRATLLVSPLSTITNWEDQIKAHIAKKRLSYLIYHGSNRTDDAAKLANYDLIITTYSVVSADYDRRSRKRKSSPLEQVNWFRIVLDEAHMIRDQATRQSRAVCALTANRRWAVTGTPVQNRLEDLGALIKFLRIKPFDDQKNFAQFITAPFKNADTETIPKLRLLVDSITLRRLKDKIDLPPRHEQIVKLDFADTERSLYDWFSKESKEKVRAMTNQKQGLGGSAYAHILRALLRLRMICAHGGELLNDEDYDAAKGWSATNAIDLESEDDKRPDRTPRQAFEMFRMIKDANMNTCAKCDMKIEADDDYKLEETDEAIGFLLPCNQLVCPRCIKAFMKELKGLVGADNYCHCPSCSTYIRAVAFELKQGEIDDDEQAQADIKKNPRLAKHMGRYGGPHTKTKHLLAALQEDEKWTEEHPEERPIKSVVFTTWTQHLDLIQIALSDADITYTRLDGSMSRKARTEALTAFADDDAISVILVSISAGGLGLNLTAASRVYVMEPQFNPAAEAQAVERVHRLGQTRAVHITRFIMSSSVEEAILKLQRKKQDLANLSLDKGNMKTDKAEAAKKRLEELRDLFK